MNRFWVISIVVGLVPCMDLAADEPKVPTTVKELFADFDPRKDPLDTKVVREWEKDGIIYRYVTFHIGTFKGKPARMAAFYAFPKGAEKLPGLLHLHGGGQRAFLHEVEFYAKRGYAFLSINWGGREMEEAKEGDPNPAAASASTAPRRIAASSSTITMRAFTIPRFALRFTAPAHLLGGEGAKLQLAI